MSSISGNGYILNGNASIGSKFAWTVTGYAADGASGSGAADDGDLTGVNYRLASPHTAVTGFFADTPGTYTLELTVRDGLRQTDVDTTNVVLEEVRGGSVPVDPNDRDGDGFLNEDDYFPDDRASHSDYDNDGTGNYYQADVDGNRVIEDTHNIVLIWVCRPDKHLSPWNGLGFQDYSGDITSVCDE